MFSQRQNKVTLGICFMFVFLVAYIHHDTIQVNMPPSIQEQIDSFMSSEVVNSTMRLKFFQNISIPRFSNIFSNISFHRVRQRPSAYIPKVLLYSTPITELTDEQRKLKTILIWHYAYGEKTMGFGYGQEPFKAAKCKENRCLMTDNRNLMPTEEFDAVIMHFRDLKNQKLPQNRSRNQRWIFYEMESASYIFNDPKKYDGLFNWTATYRSDSDVWARYGIVVKRKKPSNKAPFDLSITVQKTKKAAWFVSNCQSMSWRENLVTEMQKFMQVDIYGGCGTLKCENNPAHDCDKMLERDYKFYLSFENSYCKDYVTEKLFRILRRQVIPVVYGNNDYEKIAPKGSFIDIRDFEDTRALTDYLKYLDKNVTAYNEYFEWKKDYEVLDDYSVRAALFCDICQKLHEDQTPKVYENLRKWFVTQGQCTRIQPMGILEKILQRYSTARTFLGSR